MRIMKGKEKTCCRDAEGCLDVTSPLHSAHGLWNIRMTLMSAGKNPRITRTLPAPGGTPTKRRSARYTDYEQVVKERERKSSTSLSGVTLMSAARTGSRQASRRYA
jgi:hypothetical protein